MARKILDRGRARLHAPKGDEAIVLAGQDKLAVPRYRGRGYVAAVGSKLGDLDLVMGANAPEAGNQQQGAQDGRGRLWGDIAAV